MHKIAAIIRTVALSAGLTALTVTALDAADIPRSKPVKASRAPVVSHDATVERVYRCRAGWRQTLVWGKVRPRYDERCFYRTVSR